MGAGGQFDVHHDLPGLSVDDDHGAAQLTRPHFDTRRPLLSVATDGDSLEEPLNVTEKRRVSRLSAVGGRSRRRRGRELGQAPREGIEDGVSPALVVSAVVSAGAPPEPVALSPIVSTVRARAGSEDLASATAAHLEFAGRIDANLRGREPALAARGPRLRASDANSLA